MSRDDLARSRLCLLCLVKRGSLGGCVGCGWVPFVQTTSSKRVVKPVVYRNGLTIPPLPHMTFKSFTVEFWTKLTLDNVKVGLSVPATLNNGMYTHSQLHMSAGILFEHPALRLIVFTTKSIIG